MKEVGTLQAVVTGVQDVQAQAVGSSGCAGLVGPPVEILVKVVPQDTTGAYYEAGAL